MAVQPHRDHLTKVENPENIGVYKRPEFNERASQFGAKFSAIQEHNYEYFDRVARIYMPNMKSTQCHPKEKNLINHWVIEFESWGSFKSHLMGWSKANSDMF